jgi:hypothetical protein
MESFRYWVSSPAQLALHEKQDESSLAGAFPVISRAQERVVLGFDDKHLDFRIVVEAVGVDAQSDHGDDIGAPA